MVFKKLQNKILVHMKTFDKAYIRILDHLLGREKCLSVFFRTVFRLYVLSSNSFYCQYPLINYSDFNNKEEMVDEKKSLDNKISAVHEEKQNELNGQTSFEKPKMSYKKLIAEALNNSSSGMLLASDIYKAISAKHPYYKMETTKHLKKSIRSYLSNIKIFVKEGNTKYWKLDQEE